MYHTSLIELPFLVHPLDVTHSRSGFQDCFFCCQINQFDAESKKETLNTLGFSFVCKEWKYNCTWQRKGTAESQIDSESVGPE